MSFLVRLLLTVLLLPVWLIVGFSPSFLWVGYEGRKERVAKRQTADEQQQAACERRQFEIAERREEASRAANVAEWLSAHPVEAARIHEEERRRLIVKETKRRAKLAAEEAKHHEERMAIEAALAKPMSEEKAKLLSEMPLPPNLADLRRLARPD